MNKRKCRFFGNLPNGNYGMVVAIDVADHAEAIRIMGQHTNLRSYKFEGDTQGDLFSMTVN